MGLSAGRNAKEGKGVMLALPVSCVDQSVMRASRSAVVGLFWMRRGWYGGGEGDQGTHGLPPICHVCELVLGLVDVPPATKKYLRMIGEASAELFLRQVR